MGTKIEEFHLSSNKGNLEILSIALQEDEGCVVVFLAQRAVWRNFEIWECCPILILHTGRILAPIFGRETEGIWTRVLHRSCICICELDVKILNHPNWTSTTHVMVHFPGLPQLRLFLSLCPDFGTSFRC